MPSEIMSGRLYCAYINYRRALSHQLTDTSSIGGYLNITRCYFGIQLAKSPWTELATNQYVKASGHLTVFIFGSEGFNIVSNCIAFTQFAIIQMF